MDDLAGDGSGKTMDDTQDRARMEIALDLAREAWLHGEVPVGALVVAADGQILGRGRNASIGACDPTAHAEVQALRDAARVVENYRLPGTTVYCTVEPCLMCLGAMVQARIDRLVFGAYDPKTGATARLDELQSAKGTTNHCFEIDGGILAHSSATLLRDFFRERRNQPEL